MTKINDIVLKRICVGLIRLYTKTNYSFYQRTISIYGRHIDDVKTSLRRGFEMGDHLQIKGKTSLRF